MGFQHTMEKELKRRIALAWIAFWSLKFILLDKKLNQSIEFETLASCISPCLTYGCQTWNLISVQKKHLQVCQRKMERKILSISLRDRISNTRIRELAKTDEMTEQAEILKWKWGGHVARLQSSRWAQISTMWNHHTGRRQRGRPAS